MRICRTPWRSVFPSTVTSTRCVFAVAHRTIRRSAGPHRPRSASRAAPNISASMPMPHVSKKIFPDTSPTSERFTFRSAMTRAASTGLSGMPRPFAIFMKLPNGRIPRIASVPMRAIAAGATVPSPPATSTTRKPSATALFRLYLLESLAAGPSRPATLLAAIAAERLPFAAGAFGRALQSLIEGGYLAPAAAANVCLTSLGAAERAQERERWAEMLPTLVRLLGDAEPRPFPVVAQVAPPRERPVAEAYLDRVLVASVRERIAAAKDGGPTFAVVLAQLDVEGVGEATRRAMVHRALRATLGATATLLGGDVSAYRYGDSGVAALAPTGRDAARAERLRTLVRARLDELMRTMTSTVRAFGMARWNVRAGAATWSDDVATTTVLLRQAEAALAGDNDRRDAA